MVVVFSADQTSSTPNRSIAKLYNIHWLGNVVVVKCAKRDPKQVIQMGWGDRQLVDVLIGL